jgi:3-oxoacyl-(acyl-carrier-protein) synthase/3-hydroxymyristoyl/3-hydroxydecanoyl-(acyl carrier protein) dehydratase
VIENAPIAVVGMAGVFPGAPEIDRFWRNIVDRIDTSAEIPEDRWIPDRYHPEWAPDRSVSKHACLIRNFIFNPAGFAIDSDLLEALDPLHHLALHAGRKALSEVCLDRTDRNRIGVVLAAIALPTEGASAASRKILEASLEKRLFPREYPVRGISLSRKEALRAKVTSLPASILARALELGGGSYTLDAACASSLYAIKLACDALKAHRADVMLAGGVSRPDCIYTQIGFSQLRALSATGRCAPFDARADGLVVGEGAGILVLKRLSDALHEGDTVYGVICGIGLSNDIGGNLLAPDREGQLRAMRKAYASAGWSPDRIDLIECHGTGTPVGDSVELKGLAELWKDLAGPAGRCVIGSVKSMIGHLLTGAGAAGVIKTLLAMKNKMLPPSLHFQNVPPGSPLPGSPFKVLSSAEPWEKRQPGVPRRAAVSAFGFGGVNAHLLIEEWEGRSPQSMQGPKQGLLPASRLRGCEFAAMDDGKNAADAAAVAVIGIGVSVGSIRSWTDFQEALTNGRSIVEPRPANRWKGCEEAFPDHATVSGAFMDAVRIDPAAFRIPPAEISDILPQQLLMLKTAADAMRDAGIPLRKHRPETGAVIGIDFDYGATDFELRWHLHRRIEEWNDRYHLGLPEQALNAWADRQKEACGPPLTANRTLGALGSIVASRVAREFHLGGPSFTVSCEEASGLRAVEIGIRLLQQRECETVLVGAVDLAGDIRKVLVEEGIRSAEGPKGLFPGDGAAALVIKRLDRALSDRDGIHAVIRGIGASGGASPESARRLSLAQAAAEAGISPEAIRHIETGTAGRDFFGSCGAAAGLISLIRACLLLRRKGEPECIQGAFLEEISADGVCMHAVLEAAETDPPPARPPLVKRSGGKSFQEIVVVAGGSAPEPVFPPKSSAESKTASSPRSSAGKADADSSFHDLFSAFEQTTRATAEAHRTFLKLSSDITNAYADTFSFQMGLLERAAGEGETAFNPEPADATSSPSSPQASLSQALAFSREMCMEFAVGSVSKVLGPAFARVDAYRARVRLPDEPLMLVDRILSIEGEKGSLGPGAVVTEHDVLPGAWYLDGGRAPVCISVEAGQADLFLCAYLGIDLAVRGERTYRLLDAKVKFHRTLPRPGEVIRYHIRIERFVRQGETYLFFFNFKGFIGKDPLITMRDGCAGFFTESEIRSSGGILPAEKTIAAERGKLPSFRSLPIPARTESYDDAAVDALRAGDLSACFGPDFEAILLPESLRLPNGRMRLIHRVLSLDPPGPGGGICGLGRIRAEADIHPDDWFLTCHFVDDPVMPGTLMYECCAHTLRVLMQRYGWVTDNPAARYEPVTGVESVLKCRGPVTPKTRRVLYQVDIREIGYRPEPYMIADAQMYADDHRIVLFKNMSMKMTGTTQEEIEGFWEKRKAPSSSGKDASGGRPCAALERVFTKERILAFAAGDPSEAFGKKYEPFDRDRFIARLPAPPYSFIDRVTACEPDPWVLKPDGWITAEYDVNPDAWFFRAARSPYIPFSVLLEIALQPCGWLAAYMGSALHSEKDLKFRNLGGRAVLHRNIPQDAGTLSVRCRLTNASVAGDMIIEHFDFRVLQAGRPVYEGTSYFGFFSEESLANQVGIRTRPYPAAGEDAGGSFCFQEKAPIYPDDDSDDSVDSVDGSTLKMPSKALQMVDCVNFYQQQGGSHGLGRILGSKPVDPDEWFFKAHFFQDPVWPGSLGIESLLQLLKHCALERWSRLKDSHVFGVSTGVPHEWTYRGQVLPSNRRVEVEGILTRVEESPGPRILADGYLSVDRLCIYEMKGFGVELLKSR